jgi:hypothetical protein
MMEWWYVFRWWFAGKIVGLDLHDEIDAAYNAGMEYGQAKRFLDEQRDERTTI